MIFCPYVGWTRPIRSVSFTVRAVTLLNCHENYKCPISGWIQTSRKWALICVSAKYSALFNLKESILNGYLFSHKSHWFISKKNKFGYKNTIIYIAHFETVVQHMCMSLDAALNVSNIFFQIVNHIVVSWSFGGTPSESKATNWYTIYQSLAIFIAGESKK